MYNHDASQLYGPDHYDVSHTRMTTLASYFLSYFPLLISDAISYLLHNLNTVWYTCIIMILYSYVKHVMMMCHVQE